MRQSLRLFVPALAFAVVAMAPVAEAAEEYVSKAKATKLLETPLTGAEGKTVHIVHFSAPPGFEGGRHSHPGPAFVYILEGQLTIEIDGMDPVTLGPGDVFQEPVGNKVMQAVNKSSTHGVKLVVFQIGDDGVPLMVKAE